MLRQPTFIFKEFRIKDTRAFMYIERKCETCE